MVSKEREFRLRAIADYIASNDYDVVALQELWMWDDFEYLKRVAASKYPSIEFFYRWAAELSHILEASEKQTLNIQIVEHWVVASLFFPNFQS